MLDMYISWTQFYHTKYFQSAISKIKFLYKTKLNKKKMCYQLASNKVLLNGPLMTNQT